LNRLRGQAHIEKKFFSQTIKFFRRSRGWPWDRMDGLMDGLSHSFQDSIRKHWVRALVAHRRGGWLLPKRGLTDGFSRGRH
jgi:hypothetical protein